MSNRINPYHNSLIHSLRPAPQRSEAPAREAESPQQAAKAAAPPAPSAADGLSTVEQQMIDRYFPASETLSMRLYGANRGAETINPGAVGSHLDVRG